MVAERCLDESLMSISDIKSNLKQLKIPVTMYKIYIILGICMQEKKIGPCRMNINNTRYYYDMKLKKCLEFEYGGKPK